MSIFDNIEESQDDVFERVLEKQLYTGKSPIYKHKACKYCGADGKGAHLSLCGNREYICRKCKKLHDKAQEGSEGKLNYSHAKKFGENRPFQVDHCSVCGATLFHDYDRWVSDDGDCRCSECATDEHFCQDTLDESTTSLFMNIYNNSLKEGWTDSCGRHHDAPYKDQFGMTHNGTEIGDIDDPIVESSLDDNTAEDILSELFSRYSKEDYESMTEDNRYELIFEIAMEYVDGDDENFNSKVQTLADIAFDKIENN